MSRLKIKQTVIIELTACLSFEILTNLKYFIILELPAEVVDGGLIEDPQGGVILAGACGSSKLLRLQHVGPGNNLIVA